MFEPYGYVGLGYQHFNLSNYNSMLNTGLSNANGALNHWNVGSQIGFML